MMKKLISGILCLAMLLGMLPAAAFLAVKTSAATQEVPVEIAASDTGTVGVWYNNGSVYNTTVGSANYIEVVENGNGNTGALHVYQDNVANNDMSLGIFTGGQAAGTYTLKLDVKGDLGLLGQTCRFYPFGSIDQFANIHNQLGTDSVSDWTTVTYENVEIGTDFFYLIFTFSKYNWQTDMYIDNVQLINSSGVDVLEGAGSFYCVTSAETTPDSSEDVVSTLHASDPGTLYEWYNDNGYTATDDMYIEIVEEGADDAGAIHVYQTDGVTGTEDMRVNVNVESLPAGTYTLKCKIKGIDLGNTDTNWNGFYISGQGILHDTFRNLAGAKTLSNWTELSVSVTVSSDVTALTLYVSRYVNGADYYIDNVQLLDESGSDVLGGAGSFCVTKEDSPFVTATLYDADPGQLYAWFNGNGYTATDDMYIEIVEEGADDAGAIHVYQTDGVTGTEDMQVNVNVESLPAGTYTLKCKIKGTDLGNTDTNWNGFYISGQGILHDTFRNLAGAKTLSDWTELSISVTVSSDVTALTLYVSRYVNGADYYIDNVQLLDESGSDVLNGAGNFCTVSSGESEEEPSEGIFTLDASAMCSAYDAPDGVWTPMYPTGSPDSGTWSAWDDTHYGEIVAAGYRDRGSLHLKSVSSKNAGVAIGVDMVVGESYTLGLWAKGTSNSGRVLGQYGNGDPVVIATDTSLTSDWSYYECVFTASMGQLNLVASDWGNSNIYIDNITLIGKDGVDLLDGYGDFCTDEYRMSDSKTLLDFNEVAESDLNSVSGQTSVEGASDPTLTLNTEEAETGNAMQATWSYDGTNPSYLHRYVATQDTWAGTFADRAGDYRYLRMWISNPSHISVDVSVLLTGEDTVNYFNAAAIKLIRKDGIEVYGSVNNNSGYGEGSCISVPKQFIGWLSIPLDVAGLLAADGYSTVISDFANVTEIQLEFCKIATTGEGDSSEYYYVVDDICLSRDITGQQKSTEDGNDYADYDTSVKGEGQVKNIIFLIGDGMGYGSLDVARLDRPTLYMDTIEALGGVVGEVATTNIDGDITDSAAAGTALATGFLTKNSVLGLSENLEPVMNLGEYMKQLGKKLGLVTTTYVLDATPAAFASHTYARGNYTSIALDILALGVDVVQGGGRSYMTAKVMDENGNAVTLTELAQSQYGYSYATNASEMEAVTSGKLWGLYQDDNMSYMKENSATDPTLAEMTIKSLELLENEDGFFLMVEGGQIDLAGHSNSAIDTRLETLAFDDAVKVAMDYVDSNPDTLLIITADHETGGVSVAEDGTVSYYSTSHTDELVPYYAYGAGAECFEDLSVNIEINYAIRQATIGDVSVGASTVATDAQLTDTEVMTVVNENGIITYTGVEQPASISIPEATAAYAVVKYKTDEVNLVGAIDDAKIQYAGDGKWHISDILTLTAGDTHTFQPMSYIKGETYNSIEIAGMSVQIDWVGFFDSYEEAAAFQAHAALTGATPTALNSLSMSLSDDLDMHFYVAADETNLENTTVTLTVGGESISSAPAQLDEATGNYKFSVSLAAAQMTDTVTFQLKIGEDVIETGTYSVRQYADLILAGDYEEATKTLVTEMLNYGAAAQTYFGYNTDSLANTGITGAGEESVPTQAEADLVISDNAAELDYYAASLVFHSRIAVRFYFEGDVTGCSFAANGQALTATEKDGMYYVEVADILPQDLDEQVTVTVTDAQGSTLTVSYSPMNYIVRMSVKGSDTLQALLQAMYNYHLAAEACTAA